MSKPMDYGEANSAVTKDLIQKAIDDIGQVVRRLYGIAPKPVLPIALAVASSAMLPIVAELHRMTGEPSSGKMDPDCVMLAALLMARTSLGGDNPIAAAYADFDVLKAAGRAALSDEVAP